MSESLSLVNVRATSTAATIGFHKIRRFVGVQELATVLGDLREGFAFELDFDSGFLFKGFRGTIPSLGLAGIVLFVIPERQAIWRFLVLRGCRCRMQRERSAPVLRWPSWPVLFSYSFLFSLFSF